MNMGYNKLMDNRGLSLKELIIFTALLLLIIVLGILLLNTERARVRDAKRIADITQLRYGFEVLFNEKNSYAEAAEGCSKEGSLASSCNLSKYLPNIKQIKDPGKYSYVVSVVPNNDNFGISFVLERNYGRLVAGRHTLTPAGIK